MASLASIPLFSPVPSDAECWSAAPKRLESIGDLLNVLTEALESTGAEVHRVSEDNLDFVMCGRLVRLAWHDPAEEQLGPEYDAWLDRLEWERRMEDAHWGCVFEPKSTPISDQDIDAVNVAG